MCSEVAPARVLDQPGGARVSGPLLLTTVGPLERQLLALVRRHPGPGFDLDLQEVTGLDRAGAALLRHLARQAERTGRSLRLSGLPAHLRPTWEQSAAAESPPPPATPRMSSLERLGDRLYATRHGGAQFLYLASDLSWAAVRGLGRRSGIRPGAFLDEAIAVGSRAVPIVALVLFTLGAVSALQASVQLQKFGSNIYVANLLAVSILSELGPLMTAIVVAGRSGSAIAAEVATMGYTEELDALRALGLEPLRYLAVPKLWALLLCLPLLTVLADVIGLAAGTLVSVLAFDLSATAFVNRLLDALRLKHLLTGVAKSLSFAWTIALIGVYRGLRFRGGAEGVGRATTAAVVSSLFAIILLDGLWGIVFYIKR